MTHFNNTNTEQISEEAHGDLFFLPDGNGMLPDLNFDEFFSDSNLAGVCDYNQFTQSIAANPVEPNELDGYLGPLNLQNSSFECDNKRALINTLPAQPVVQAKKSRSLAKTIPLSESVGVGVPQKNFKPSHKVEIVHLLEESYRPRYKSDYFTLNGKSRKPRYVADRIGNHYITLRVPVGSHGQIRVDWLTIPDASGCRYWMPYRFQRSNESIHVPDCNPLYLNIEPDKNGIMKLYLVLIKSKQDELKYSQPLQPFQPLKDALGGPEKVKTEMMYPLNPKQLIKKYGLDQSQLAFTFCALASDGKPIPEWDTTVFSTILTELPPENTKSKAISCPRCSHQFQISLNNSGTLDQDGIQETTGTATPGNKRKEHQYMNDETIKRQHSLQDDTFDFSQ